VTIRIAAHTRVSTHEEHQPRSLEAESATVDTQDQAMMCSKSPVGRP
jgi:hypothetical protein